MSTVPRTDSWFRVASRIGHAARALFAAVHRQLGPDGAKPDQKEGDRDEHSPGLAFRTHPDARKADARDVDEALRFAPPFRSERPLPDGGLELSPRLTEVRDFRAALIAEARVGRVRCAALLTKEHRRRAYRNS